MYLRFVVTEIDEDSERALGVFHAVRCLRDMGKLYPYEEDQHDMVRWWFNENLERPTRFTASRAPLYRKKSRALSWFKDTATEYPLDIQEKREQFMVKRIAELMVGYERGLFVVGMNHLHSCMTKLKLAGFDVKGGNWLRIPDTAKHLECPNCHELLEVRVEYDAKVLAAEETTEQEQDTSPTSAASGKSNAPIIPPHPKDCRCISCEMKRGT